MNKKSKFIFDGNDACLDFVNTEIVERGKKIDLLEDYNDLMEWLGDSGLADSNSAGNISTKNRKKRESILKRAKSFRAELKDMAEMIANKKTVKRSAIDSINQILKSKAFYSRLALKDGRVRMESHTKYDFNDPLFAIAEAAANLVSNRDLSLVKKCDNPVCVLFFYDASKNHGRRWCSMSRCGNRMKSAAHYKRKGRK